jgi:hypothetical protein
VHQTRLLARAFFTRLFESDLMPDGLPQVQLVIWGMLLAATPNTAYAIFALLKYNRAQFVMPLGPEFDVDRLILITLSMIAIGVVGLVIWDGVFPDRRDVRVLGVLPIPTHRFVLARLASLGRVLVLFATPLCLLQSVAFGLTVTGFGAPISRIHGISAHFVTVAIACAFVFSALITAQCLLLLLFGRRAAQAASVTFQVLFAVGLVQLLFFLPELGRILRAGGASHEELSTLAALPPTWFFGLYEVLAGAAGANSAALARLAVGLTIGAAMAAVGLYAASYDRLSQRALEGVAPRASAPAFRPVGRGRWLGVFANRPVTEAVRAFTIRTLFRSRTHRMMFAVYGGFAFAIILSSAVSIALRNRGAGFWEPGISMMSMPLVAQFLLLSAVRAIVGIPSEPKARWVFRVSEPGNRHAAVNGLRDAMLVLVVLPTTAFALVQGVVFWSPAAAISHTAFTFVVGRLLAEILMSRTGKLPFACTYFPGSSRIFSLWPIYLLAFFFYAVVFAVIDRALSSRPGKLAWFCLAAIVVAETIVLYRRHVLNAMPGLRFEEEDPQAIFQGFHLSEGLAAAPRATPVAVVPDLERGILNRAPPSA